MRILGCSVALLALLVLGVSADVPPAGKDKDSPPPDKGASQDAPSKDKGDPANLPGSFHPYNVTGPNKGRFHCLVSEHGLEPMVMIFHKNVEFGDPLPDLLKKLDTAIEKNPSTRLGSFVVFLPEELPDIVGTNDANDDARLELEKKVEQAGADMKLKHVVMCLDSKNDVEKYNLRDDDLVTILLYNKLKVVAKFALPKSEFTGATVEKVLAAVAEKLGAARW